MHTVEKILIIRFGSIGDIVLTSPLLRAARARFPGARIDFLTKSTHAELLRCNPHLSSIIEFGSEGGNLRSIANAVRQTRYDVILDLQDNFRSLYVRFFSGAKSIRVIHKRIIPRFFLVHGKRNLYSGIVPIPVRYLETGSDFGIIDDGKGLELFIPEGGPASVRAVTDKLESGGFEQIIALAPSAKHNTKMWLQERFVEYAIQQARVRKTKFVILGGAADMDRCEAISQGINEKAGQGSAESFAGRLSILETAAILDRCHLLVTNDSGLLHVGAARGKKIIALFGPTVEEFGFFPFRADHIVLQTAGLPCRPCSPIGGKECPQGHFLCMKNISTEAVLAATEQILGQ